MQVDRCSSLVNKGAFISFYLKKKAIRSSLSLENENDMTLQKKKQDQETRNEEKPTNLTLGCPVLKIYIHAFCSLDIFLPYT